MYDEKFKQYFGKSEKIDSLIEVLLKIDKNKIDFERSKFGFKVDQIYIELFGINNEQCPLNIVLGLNGKSLDKVTLEIPGVQNIFYYDDVSSDESFFKHVQHTFKVLFCENILRREYFINGACHKTELSCSNYEFNNKKGVSFENTHKPIWLWQKPEIKETKYSSWI